MGIGSSTVAVDGMETDLLDKTANGNELAFLSNTVAAVIPGSSADLVLSNTFFITPADNG